jgi:hypothetical protein
MLLSKHMRRYTLITRKSAPHDPSLPQGFNRALARSQKSVIYAASNFRALSVQIRGVRVWRTQILIASRGWRAAKVHPNPSGPTRDLTHSTKREALERQPLFIHRRCRDEFELDARP